MTMIKGRPSREPKSRKARDRPSFVMKRCIWNDRGLDTGIRKGQRCRVLLAASEFQFLVHQ